jgi:hypothetical protein
MRMLGAEVAMNRPARPSNAVPGFRLLAVFGLVTSLVVGGLALVGGALPDWPVLFYLEWGMVGLAIAWCVLVGWFPRGINLAAALSFLMVDTVVVFGATATLFVRAAPGFRGSVDRGGYFAVAVVSWLFAIIPFVLLCSMVAVTLVFGVSSGVRHVVTRPASPGPNA